MDIYLMYVCITYNLFQIQHRLFESRTQIQNRIYSREGSQAELRIPLAEIKVSASRTLRISKFKPVRKAMLLQSAYSGPEILATTHNCKRFVVSRR